MAREMAKAVTSAVLLLAISGGFAFPRVLRQSRPEPPAGGSLNNFDYGDANSGQDFSVSTSHPFVLELTTATDIPEEIKEDIHKLAEVVEREEQRNGHPITKTEAEQMEKELENLPWYKKLGNWFQGAYHTTKKAIKGIFSSEKSSRDQRGFHTYYLER